MTRPTYLLAALALSTAFAVSGCRTSGQAQAELRTVAAYPSPAVMNRSAWGASSPSFAMTPQIPSSITVHHTATPQDPTRTTAQKVLALQQFSQRADVLGDGRAKPAWADIPYHFYIAPDGVIAEGRNPRFQGDSNTDYDLAGHIQVVLEGNFEDEQPSEAQIQSLTNLVRSLASEWEITADHVNGHQDEAPTLCPGKALYSRLPDLRRVVSISARN